MCEDVVFRFILGPLICKELPLNQGLNALRQFVEIGRNFYILFLVFLRSNSFGREKQRENNCVQLPYSRAICLRGVMTNQPRNVIRYICFKFYSFMIHALSKLKEAIPCK